MTEDDDTRGMSQRELIIETRYDVKEMRRDLSGKVGRGEMYSALGMLVTVVVGYVLFAL